MTNLFDHLHDLISRQIHPTDHEEEIWDRYGKKVAVMVIDSSGFSRVTEQHGIVHFLSQLMMMRKLIRKVCGKYHHHAFRFEADNVYAVFDHPDEAVHAALRIHEVIHEKKLMLTPDEPFRVCIGIGFGDCLYSETMEGYFGEEMNLASKLGEDTAVAGETLITEAVYEHADEGLVESFTPRRLKIAGIEAPCHSYVFKP
jgi:class 3 adenylate cyclase